MPPMNVKHLPAASNFSELHFVTNSSSFLVPPLRAGPPLPFSGLALAFHHFTQQGQYHPEILLVLPASTILLHPLCLPDPSARRGFPIETMLSPPLRFLTWVRPIRGSRSPGETFKAPFVVPPPYEFLSLASGTQGVTPLRHFVGLDRPF